MNTSEDLLTEQLDIFEERYPTICEIVSLMLKTNSAKRPTFSEVILLLD